MKETIFFGLILFVLFSGCITPEQFEAMPGPGMTIPGTGCREMEGCLAFCEECLADDSCPEEAAGPCTSIIQQSQDSTDEGITGNTSPAPSLKQICEDCVGSGGNCTIGGCDCQECIAADNCTEENCTHP